MPHHELTTDQTRRLGTLEQSYRLTRQVPDTIDVPRLRAIELEQALVDLRAAGETFGAAVVEIVLGDLRAEIRERERAIVDATAAEERRQERAAVLDAPRQVEALEADGGASEMTVAQWLAHVERSAGETQ